MIVIVVGIGATVFAFATNGFVNFGSGFSNLVSNSNDQISEQIVVEQVVFVNPSGSPTSSGLTLYVRDVGINPSTIAAVYVENLTANSFVKQFTSTPLPVTIQSGVVQSISITGFVPDHGTTYSVTVATQLGNTVILDAKYN